MERKTFLCVFTVLLWLIAFAVSSFAGEVFMNGTGEVAKALRIVFSEVVEIASFGGAFSSQEPLGEATEFLFCGGEAQAWDSFWISWEPASATIVEAEWLPEIPTSTGRSVLIAPSTDAVHLPSAQLETETSVHPVE